MTHLTDPRHPRSFAPGRGSHDGQPPCAEGESSSWRACGGPQEPALLLGRLLPPWACTSEVRALPEDLKAVCHSAELRVLPAAAVALRRREFAAGRACARVALVALAGRARRADSIELDAAHGPLLRRAGGAPAWPPGTLGSLTHTRLDPRPAGADAATRPYCAAAVARCSDAAALGVDAEPAVPLPRGLLDSVATQEERQAVAARRSLAPHVPWDRLLFSAKEAAYKAWWPLRGRGSTSREVEVCFSASDDRLTIPAPHPGLPGLVGAYGVAEGALVTAVHAPR